MKKKLFLITTLATLSLGGNAFGRESDLRQTNPASSAKQTDMKKKEAKEKRDAAKKEAAENRKQAKSAAKNTPTTAKKKHKKFLGIF